jgi:hypothetical protein
LGTETGPDTQFLGEMLWRDLHPSQAVNAAPIFTSGPAIPIHSAAMVPEYLPPPEPTNEVGGFQPLSVSESDAEMGGNSGEDDQYEIEDKEEEIPNMSRHSDNFKTRVAEALTTLINGAPAATVPGPEAPITIQTPENLGWWRDIIFNIALMDPIKKRKEKKGKKDEATKDEIKLKAEFWDQLIPWASNIWIMRQPKIEGARQTTWPCRYSPKDQVLWQGSNVRAKVRMLYGSNESIY